MITFRPALLILAILAAPGLRASEDFATLVKKGDAFDAALKTKEALAVYLEAEKLQPNDADLLHKIAKQYGETMDDVTSKADKEALGMKSLRYAKRAVAADPQNAMAQLAAAVAHGRVATYLDNKTKIAYSKLVKEHVDKSLALDPNNDLTYHVLGAWHYELANLNPLLRAIAKLIYGDIPAASNEEAVKNYKKAIELNPKRLANHVELGRAYVALGQKEPAKAELEKGLSMPNRQRDDDEEKRRAREALKKI
jgi:tetratricopeptide (TPR) repeat protein